MSAARPTRGRPNLIRFNPSIAPIASSGGHTGAELHGARTFVSRCVYWHQGMPAH